MKVIVQKIFPYGVYFHVCVTVNPQIVGFKFRYWGAKFLSRTSYTNQQQNVSNVVSWKVFL